MVADCLEALIAAIYLDMGEEKSREFVINYIIEPQKETGEINEDKNYKGQLLEFAHANKMDQPEYRIIDQSGPQHDKIYTSEVSLPNSIYGVGKGPTKKIAEQLAAKHALSKLDESNNSEK
jgi:ribonuclease-3